MSSLKDQVFAQASNFQGGFIPTEWPKGSDFLPMYMRQIKKRWKQFALILLILWALTTTFMILSYKPPNELLVSARQLHFQIDLYAELIKTMKKDCRLEPPELYEIIRRRLYANIIDLWHYTSSEIKQIMKDVPKLSKSAKVQEFVEEFEIRKRSLLSDHTQMSELDGYHAWRQREATNVSDLIQRRLKYLQNPYNCRKTNKVVCDLQKTCGFGCQLHHVAYCLVFAYATERTLILRSRGWAYSDKGWEFFFQPISETCTTTYDEKASHWPRGLLQEMPSVNEKVVKIPVVDFVGEKPMFFPLSVPMDLSQRIIRFTGDPAAWWIGQLMKYIIRLQPPLQKRLDELASRLAIMSPIVGMQIRRTDKLDLEADFHSIHEYMLHVTEYFEKLEMTRKVNRRRVYLGTDDMNVLGDVRLLYPEYTFMGNSTISLSAQPGKREDPSSLEGLLIDMYMLSKCDFVVGTFSSQVGRVVYELMQANRADASQSFYSLDDIYYFGGQHEHFLYSVLAHKVKDSTKLSKRMSLKGLIEEIDLEAGDAISVKGNHLDGFGLGTNMRTQQYGLFPWYKATDRMALYRFPEYKQVPLYERK